MPDEKFGGALNTNHPSLTSDRGKEDWLPDPKQYQAFGFDRVRSFTSLIIHLNKDGRQKYKKQAIQLQYPEVQSDDPQEGCGLSEDGTSFTYIFAGVVKQKLTVHGRNLMKGWAYTSFHKLSFIYVGEPDRDFKGALADDEPFVESVTIERIEEQD